MTTDKSRHCSFNVVIFKIIFSLNVIAKFGVRMMNLSPLHRHPLAAARVVPFQPYKRPTSLIMFFIHLDQLPPHRHLSLWSVGYPYLTSLNLVNTKPFGPAYVYGQYEVNVHPNNPLWESIYLPGKYNCIRGSFTMLSHRAWNPQPGRYMAFCSVIWLNPQICQYFFKMIVFSCANIKIGVLRVVLPGVWINSPCDERFDPPFKSQLI